jgi:hypothetical protein
LTFVHISKEKRKKLDYRATPRIFVRYSISTKQYFVYNPVAATLHCSQDVVFREGKQYPAPNAADEAILNEHFYRDVIKEPKPKPTPTKRESETFQPTVDENSECQMEESLDDDSPPDPPKPKRKKSRELTAFEMSLREEWKLLAEGSRRNHAGKLAESAQLAREDEEFEDMILIYATAAISNDHQDGINDPTCDKAATESPLADKWDTAIKEELDAIG